MARLPHPRLRRPTRGVTLVEALAGVVLLVAVVGLVLPAMDPTRHRLDGEAASLASTLRAAGRRAVLRGHAMVVTFDPEGRLRIHHDVDGDGRIDENEELRILPLLADVAFGRGAAPPLPAGGARVTFTGRQDGLPAFTFQGTGGASETGAVYLTSRLPGRRPEDTRALVVDARSGTVTCLAYRGTAWEPGC